MRQRSAYKGYVSYSYLEPGVDYKEIEWAQWDWAGRHIIELSDEEEARLAELLAASPYVSLHEHPDFCT